MNELQNKLTAHFRGHDIPYTLKDMTSDKLRKLAHMRDPEATAEWGIDMYIETIYDRPAEDANALVKWVVWQDSQDFLTHMEGGIGRVGSPYESKEAQARREKIEELLRNSQKSGSQETT